MPSLALPIVCAHDRLSHFHLPTSPNMFAGSRRISVYDMLRKEREEATMGAAKSGAEAASGKEGKEAAAAR